MADLANFIGSADVIQNRITCLDRLARSAAKKCFSTLGF
jgi:hypothetical protein